MKPKFIQVCAYCKKWRRLICVGYHGEQTLLCIKCSGFKLKKDKDEI